VCKRKGFTLIELLVVVAIIALLISILLPSLSRAREITKRAVCASQLRGIGQGYKVYSNENFDWYPIAPYREAPANATQDDTSVTFVTRMGRKFDTQVNSTNGYDAQRHPSRDFFLLIIDGTCTAKQFVCPSSGDQEDDMRNWSGATQIAAQPGTNRFDFKGYPFVSYGCQLPFGNRGKPNENLDARMVIGADKGPYFEANSAVTDPKGCVPDKAKFTSDELLNINGKTKASDHLTLDNDSWRPYNSRNHNLEGQNTLFQDDHVTFEKRPIVGVNYDNIYTRQNKADYSKLENTMLGFRPNNLKGPLTQTDSVIVP